MDRRTMLGLLASTLGLAAGDALAGPRRRRRVRRRVRRRIRRRWRRRVVWRTLGARRALVVPVALAVGWELAVDNRVVVVHEMKPDVIIVVDSKTTAIEDIPIVKEDTAENSKDLEGTLLAATDVVASFREVDEEVEEEVDEDAL